jgi:siroheme decarboxylase
MKLSLIDRKIIDRLSKGLTLKERIFSDLCIDLGIKEDYLISRLKFFKKKGLLKKISPSINFFKLGYVKNALLAANIVKPNPSFMKEKLKSIPNITHCVIRKASLEFNYNLFMMIHAKSKVHLNQTVKVIKNIFCLKEFKLLRTQKEYKKANFVYDG